MAFSLSGVCRVSAGANANAPTIMAYATSVDTGAQVAAAGYFNNYVENLDVGDLIFVQASDGPGFYYVTAVTPNVTTSALATIGVGGVGSAQLQAGAVDNAALGADAVESDNISEEIIQYTNVAVSAAEWNGMYAAPKLLLAAGGANTLHVVHKAVFEVDYGGAQFANGGVVAIQYDSTVNGAGIAASADLAAATVNAWAADNIATLVGAGTGLATMVNKGLYLSNDTAAFDTGTSDINVHLWFSTITTAL